MTTRLIGDYVLLEQIGQGSLGVTYLAEHRFLKQLFIVKLLPKELSEDADFIQRFEKEVQALSKLEHPHIAKICNASFSDGIYYLVSEAVVIENKSTNLAEYFASKNYKLLEEEVLHLAKQIASALDYAHQMKIHEEFISHGCLKLNNIVIKQNNLEVTALITDFGLSRVIGPPEMLSRTYLAVASALSSKMGISTHKQSELNWYLPQTAELHQSFCQTFAFLAPEQKIAGHPRANSVKSDTYAFGILLYYLLTGEFPEGYFELPSKKNPDLKWNWDLFICRALQTDPVKRFDHLSEKLEEWVITTQTTSAVNYKSKYVEKNNAATLTKPQPVLKPAELTRPSFEPDPGAIFQIETTVAPYRPQPKQDTEIQPLLTEMVVIPGRAYHRGSNHGARDEMPRHEIFLASFAIDIHPTSNEQFVRFLEAMGGEKDCNNNDIIRLRESRIKRFGGKLTIESGYAKHPVVGVSWYGAVAYAKWLGKRLPTEAEWEIASYGNEETNLYPTGNSIERSQANFFSSDTTPVQSYVPNGFGLYDMAGNVYEWCQDWYDYHFYNLSVQEPNNPKGPQQGVYRILRGGCWKSSKEDIRCAHRHRNNPGVMNGTYGFRCAADVTE